MNELHLPPEDLALHAFASCEPDPHVASCAECSSRIARLRDARRLLAAAVSRPAPRRISWKGVAAGLTAAACLGVVVFALWSDSRPTASIAPRELEGSIRDFQGADAEARERAERDLRTAGSAAIPALRKALETAQTPELRSRLQDLIDDIEWQSSPKIAVPGGDATILILRRDGRTVIHRLGEPEVDFEWRLPRKTPESLVWSPDGQWIAYHLADAGGFDLVVADARNRVLPSVLSTKSFFGLRGLFAPIWSPDSQSVAMACEGRGMGVNGSMELEVFQRNPRAGGWSKFAQKGYGVPCAWKSDGTLVVFTGAQLEVLHPRTGEMSVLADASSVATRSRDGSLCYFGPRNGDVAPVQFLSPDAKKPIGLAKAIPVVNRPPLISPDARWVVYEDGGKVYVVSTRGGEPKSLGEGNSPAWAYGGWLSFRGKLFHFDRGEERDFPIGGGSWFPGS